MAKNGKRMVLPQQKKERKISNPISFFIVGNTWVAMWGLRRLEGGSIRDDGDDCSDAPCQVKGRSR